MATKGKSRIVRISEDLDMQIKDLMKKNGYKYVDASKEISLMTRKFKGKNIFKEVRF